MLWLSIAFGAVSALAWLGSALVTPDLTASFYSGPPAWHARRAKIGTLLNGVGALFASLAMGCQAYATWAAM